MARERPGADGPASDRSPGERPGADGSASDRSPGERPGADGSASDRSTGDRPASDRRGLARLSRLGFAEADRAFLLLGPADGGLGWWRAEPGGPVDERAEELVRAVAASADPDLALHQLHRLVAVVPELPAALRADHGLARRLFAVLGASAALGDHLVGSPDDWVVLASSADPDDRRGVSALRGALAPAGPAGGAAAVEQLRRSYRRVLLRVAAADLTGVRAVDDVMAELTDLADATLAAALEIARAERDDADEARLAIVAMGKTGGRELNYLSDVDVLFVAEPQIVDGPAPTGPTDSASALRVATALAVRVIDVCRQVAWQLDAGLRPEGRDGPLVRTVASYDAYYRRWAKGWEFQALLKARYAAGDAQLADEWLARVHPLLWQTAGGTERPSMVAEVRAMRRRVEDQLSTVDAEREIKLGRGGLRDIEFAVQLLQLVHGRSDPELRGTNTLRALAALTAGGYVGRADGEELAAGYRFLRTIEHRLQLQHLRRTHRIPDAEPGLRWLAQSLGYRGEPKRTAVQGFLADWTKLAHHVRRLHEKLLYRPLLEAVARVPTDSLRLTSGAAESRLAALGFDDPAGALRHIGALTGGVSRSAAIQRTLLPALLPEFADAPEPDHGLLAYRQVSEKLGRTPWYLRLLRDSGPVAIRLARLLGTSRYVTDLLTRDPEALRLLAADAELVPRDPGVLAEAMAAAVARYDRPADAVAALRALRRRELFRIACADLLGRLDVVAVGAALTEVTDAVLAAALAVARRAAGVPEALSFAVIGMGRYGGAELGFGSDADVLFVYDDAPGAAEQAHQVAETLRGLLAAPAPDPPLVIDADLRPEGRQGPLVRSLEAYRSYYRRWSRVWEAQALLRARFVAGDAGLGARFTALIDPVRYPARGLSREQVVEILRIKARVDAERLPRGADPATHTKLGRGGLADVEWTVQLLQLRHAAHTPAMRVTGTLEAMSAAVDAGLLGAAEADALDQAWRLAGSVRNAMMLVRGRGSDQLPRHGVELAGVVRALGFATDDPGEFVDEYLRTARHARQVVEARMTVDGTGGAAGG
nr:bifunctional [glutamine synthetase] adenylyltransferase/[glutamine synthetase]-adenylyl-L-tyrosine phosphorylase [Actinocatenispora sera]